MSLTYLLDGYNIIKLVPLLAEKPWDESRAFFIRWIEAALPQGSRNNQVIVVFDGQPGSWGDCSTSVVQVVFSLDESADDRIKAMVNRSKSKKTIVVVTNDRDIIYAVRAAGASSMSVEDFMRKGRQHPLGAKTLPKKMAQQKQDQSKYISKSLEFKITSEFERIWLKSKDSK